jgi:hypothetical protein
MGEAGRAKTQRNTWDDVARQMIEIYRQMLNHE